MGNGKQKSKITENKNTMPPKNETPQELNKYRSDVEYMAKNKIDLEFPNSSESHAAIVMSTMIKYAEKDVKLYIRNLDGCIFDREESSFKEYMDSFVKEKKGKLYVVVEDEKIKNTSIYNKLKDFSEQYTNNVVVRHAPKNSLFKQHILQLFKDNPSEVFFMVADNRAYRLEIDNEKHMAFCNFNETKYALKLVNAFSSKFKDCTKFF